MSDSLPIRKASVSLMFPLASMVVWGTAVAATGQSALPAAQPTASASAASAGNSPAPVNPTNQTSASKPQVKLEIAVDSGMLTVDATNASLNQVLREVARQTGMKVSGSVADERVFGRYGPLPVAEVLASLLDGTASNMLLVDSRSGPSELVLTPRRGGATPPNTNTSFANNNEARDQPQEEYVAPIRPFQPPTATGRGPVGANPDGSPAFAPQNQNGAGSGTAAPTPQQIYEQLQSLSPPPAAPPEQ